MFQKEFEELSKIIEEKVEKSKNIGIYFDSDADGACAAALFVIYLLKKFKRYPDNLISCFHDIDEKLKRTKNDLILILDTHPKMIDSSNLLIIDHHIVQNIPKKSIMFNPTIHDKKLYIATSCLIYKILNNLIDMSEACWIASIGVKADKSEELCDDIISLTYEMYPEFKDVENRLIRLTSTSRNLSDANIVVKSLVESYNIGSPSFFGKTESSSKLIKISKQVNQEVKNVLASLEKMLETEKVIVFQIHSGFNIQSLIANRLFVRHPQKVVIVYNLRTNNIVHAEVRSNQERVFYKLSEALRDVVIDIGGHERAFGLSIQKEKIPELIHRLSKVL